MGSLVRGEISRELIYSYVAVYCPTISHIFEFFLSRRHDKGIYKKKSKRQFARTDDTDLNRLGVYSSTFKHLMGLLYIVHMNRISWHNTENTTESESVNFHICIYIYKKSFVKTTCDIPRSHHIHCYSIEYANWRWNSYILSKAIFLLLSWQDSFVFRGIISLNIPTTTQEVNNYISSTVHLLLFSSPNGLIMRDSFKFAIKSSKGKLQR